MDQCRRRLGRRGRIGRSGGRGRKLLPFPLMNRGVNFLPSVFVGPDHWGCHLRDRGVAFVA